tara:strand:- start:1008 stop:1187 length:180 start_codon:yes stop_codon:yes gene_type:complete
MVFAVVASIPRVSCATTTTTPPMAAQNLRDFKQVFSLSIMDLLLEIIDEKGFLAYVVCP